MRQKSQSQSANVSISPLKKRKITDLESGSQKQKAQQLQEIPTQQSLQSLPIINADLSEEEDEVVSQQLNEKLFLPPINDTEESNQQKFLRKRREDLESYPKPRTFLEKEAGLQVIKFHPHLLIQPKFMEERGSMCSTELWSNQQKKEFCSLDLKSSQRINTLSRSTSQRTIPPNNNFYQIEQLPIKMINSEDKKRTSDIKSQIANPKFIDSKKFKMLPADRIGISYFRPEKMMQKADLFNQLKADKQGLLIQKKSLTSCIENTMNTKLPIDLMFFHKIQPENEEEEDQIESPSLRLAQGDSPISRQRSQNSPNRRQKLSKTPSFEYLSPLRKSSSPVKKQRDPLEFKYMTPLSTRQQKLQKESKYSLNTEQSDNQQIFKPSNSEKRKEGSFLIKGMKNSNQQDTMFEAKMKMLSHQNKGFNELSTRISSQKQIEMSQNYLSSPTKSYQIISPEIKSARFIISPEKKKIKQSVSNIISQCNETLIEGYTIQQEMTEGLDCIFQEKISMDKKIEKRENRLFLLN